MRLSYLNSILFDLEGFATRMVEQTGVDPRLVYCSQTGEPIGRVNDEELQLAIHMVGSNDEDSLIDDLFTRTLMSMRPSIGWNMVDSRTLNRMRVVRPRQLLSHLMIRMYDPKEYGSGLKLTFEQRMAANLSKIQIHQICQYLPVTAKQLNQLLLILLQIDATFNMNAVAVKTSFPGLANIVDADSFEQYIGELNQWHKYLTKKKLAADRLDRGAREYWSGRGNSFARVAAIESFTESTPPTEAKKKRTEKKRVEDDFLAALEEIIESANPETKAPAKAEPAKPTGFIKPGGLKLNFAKRTVS